MVSAEPSDSSSDSEADILDDRNEEGWEDIEPDVEQVQFTSLFGSETFPDINSMMEHDRKLHGFDLSAELQRLNLDFLERIKMINYIRSASRSGQVLPDITSRDKFADEKYLQPVLENDALLYSLDDIPDLPSTMDETTPRDIADMPSNMDDMTPREAFLYEELKRVISHFESFKSQVLQPDRTTFEQEGEPAKGPPPSSPGSMSPQPNSQSSTHDRGYFESYGYNEIHELMLTDTVRTDAYRDFIYDNKHLFDGRIVLDVGCGTGILSMFCARAGAAHVYAVDNSSIIEKARAHVHLNGFEGRIDCLHGKIEEITLPVDKVDVIVSEWMGYCLLNEAMLDSVIWARDRYLKPDGLMVPSHCTLHVAPLAAPDLIAENIDFWTDVYGFDMSPMIPDASSDALIRRVKPEELAAKSIRIAEYALHTVSLTEVMFSRNFRTTISKDIAALDGWVVWFDTFFLPSRTATLHARARAEDWGSERQGIAFTTGPAGRDTHWKSGVLLGDRKRRSNVPIKAGEEITFAVTFRKPHEIPRGLEIWVKWQAPSGEKGRVECTLGH